MQAVRKNIDRACCLSRLKTCFLVSLWTLLISADIVSAGGRYELKCNITTEYPIVVFYCGWLVVVNGCLPRLLTPRCSWLGRLVHLAGFYAVVLQDKTCACVKVFNNIHRFWFQTFFWFSFDTLVQSRLRWIAIGLGFVYRSLFSFFAALPLLPSRPYCRCSHFTLPELHIYNLINHGVSRALQLWLSSDGDGDAEMVTASLL
jgi:hypothetical protein